MIPEIVTWMANIMAAIFNALDSHSVDGVSILDMWIAVMWFKITIWFIMAVLRHNRESDSGETTTGRHKYRDEYDESE